MNDITFLYRCRRCGHIENHSCTSKDRGPQLLLDAICDRPRLPMAPTLLNLHTCNDDGMGVSDLIGYEPMHQIVLETKEENN
jgi:hypothetical protein